MKQCSLSLCLLLCASAASWAGTADDPPGSEEKPCIVSGCSGQVCSEESVITTCEWRAEYDCYRSAICERIDGQCGWRMSPELQACLGTGQAPVVDRE